MPPFAFDYGWLAMAVLLQAILSNSITPEAEAGEVRVAQTRQAAPQSILGSGLSREHRNLQVHSPGSGPTEDVVKVQVEPPGETVVYRFVNQQGTLVLQVPPQQLLDLAQQISQELERKVPPQVPSEGSRNHGH
jgi:hypothetical protein